MVDTGTNETTSRTRNPPPHFSRLESCDRLLVQHPSPGSIQIQPLGRLPPNPTPAGCASGASRPLGRSTLAHHTPTSCLVKKCTHCNKCLRHFEFPSSTPTIRCQHPNDMCSYCLHNSIRQAFHTSGWDGILCPDCGQRMMRVDVWKGVLLWTERE